MANEVYNCNIVNIIKNKQRFHEDVITMTLDNVLAISDDKEFLRDKISKSLHEEHQRIQKMHWNVDSVNNKFWNQTLSEIDNKNIPLQDILSKIIDFYLNGISTRFNNNYYKYGNLFNYYFFSKMLMPTKIKLPNKVSTIKRSIKDQLQIYGNIEVIKKLSEIGTIVIVPTHYSNLDSLLITLVINIIKLPPVIYGAGINLFNNMLHGLIMSHVGAYKIDRRRNDIVYLNTIKNYSTLAINYGCDSLFYPGGTRCRSGMVEDDIKIGLLKTTIFAQDLNYKKKKENGEKIFIIPLIVNYHFVIEASKLIREYLFQEYEIKPKLVNSFYNKQRTILRGINTIISKKTKIVVSFGDPVDVFGNKVDKNGNSIDNNNDIIDLYKIFTNSNDISSLARDASKTLSHEIERQYKCHNRVTTSSLIAFVAYEMVKKMYPDKGDDYILMLPSKEFRINVYRVRESLQRVRETVIDYTRYGIIDITDEIKNYSTDQIIEDGLNNLGLYNYHVPLRLSKYNFYYTEDICTLFYYHNRLVGYDLEMCI